MPSAPVTVAEEWLRAIHDRMGEILDRLPERPSPDREDGTVELREPATLAPEPQATPVEITEPAKPAAVKAGSGATRRQTRKPARKASS